MASAAIRSCVLFRLGGAQSRTVTVSSLVLYLLFALAFSVSAIAQVTSDPRAQYLEQYTESPGGVNMQTGWYSLSVTDLAIGDLTLTRGWGGKVAGFPVSQTPSGQERRWTFSVNGGVDRDYFTDRLVHVVVDGQKYSFGTLSSGAYNPKNRATNGTSLRHIANNRLLFIDKSGGQHVFFKPSGLAQPSSGPQKYRIETSTRPDGTVHSYSYRSDARLQEVRSTRGYAIHLDYDGYGNVSKACGYNLANTPVSPAAACGGEAISTSYGYSNPSIGSLSSVTDHMGVTVQISYKSVGFGDPVIGCVSVPGSGTCAVENFFGETRNCLHAPHPCSALTKPDQVTKQVMADGAVWQYAFNPEESPIDAPTPPGAPRRSDSVMVEPDGGFWSFTYDRGLLVDMVAPGLLATNYKYGQASAVIPGPTGSITLDMRDPNPSLVTTPRGDRIFRHWGLRGNLWMRSNWPLGTGNNVTLANGSNMFFSDPDKEFCCINMGLPNNPAGSTVWIQGFLDDYSHFGGPWPTGCGTGDADAKLCSKPLRVIDERGNQTDYTYDPAHGGVLTETGPAAVPGGPRPQKRYSYVQRQAWLHTGGGYAPTGQPVWLLASESICRTTASTGSGCAGGPADEVVTTYEYGPNQGPNNLLVRGVAVTAQGLTLRTCYTYDALGRKTSETPPAAGFATCP